MAAFDQAKVEVNADDRPWFKFANGEWGQALSKVWLYAPRGWLGIYLLDADEVPVLAGVDWLDNHDLSFRNHTLEIYGSLTQGSEAATTTVKLRKGNGGHRLLDVMKTPGR